MRLAILAFAVLALSGAAYSQDDSGNGGDNTAITEPSAAASSAEAPDPDNPFAITLAADAASCKLRGVDTHGLPCAGQTSTSVPSGEPESIGNVR